MSTYTRAETAALLNLSAAVKSANNALGENTEGGFAVEVVLIHDEGDDLVARLDPNGDGSYDIVFTR